MSKLLSFGRPRSLRQDIFRTAAYLLVILLLAFYGVYLLSVQKKAENNLYTHMLQVIEPTEAIVQGRMKAPPGSTEACASTDLREQRKCMIRQGRVGETSPCGPGASVACIYSVCIDKARNVDGIPEYEKYLHMNLIGKDKKDDLCQIRPPTTGTLENVWGAFRQGAKGMSAAIWGTQEGKSVNRRSYGHCPGVDDVGCVDIYESYRDLEIDGTNGRIRILVSGMSVPYWGGDPVQNGMFLIALVTATGIVLALGWLIGRKAGRFGRQANRLRDRLNDWDVTAIDDGEYAGELAGIAAAADVRIASKEREADEREAAARKIRERLMACAIELGRGMSHNENEMLAQLNGLVNSIATAAEKGQAISPEQLKGVASATQGVRTGLEGVSKQLIRWSIGDFSEASDPVDIGDTLSDAIVAVKTTCTRELIWTESVPELSAKTTQFGFYSIVVNLLRNAARHAEKNIEISAEDCGEEVEIVIEDDGAGFPPDREKRELLLKWGARALMYTRPGASGIGIGLALAAEWLRGGGGSIELSTSTKWKGGGALVKIRVRCSRALG